MEVEYVRIDFQWNLSIRYSSSWSAQRKKRKTEENDLCLRNHTFVGFSSSLDSWVSLFGFVGSLSSLWVLGFVAWVRRLGLLVRGFAGQVFNILISCFQCFADCGYRGFFFFFYSRGRRGRRRLRFSQGSFVEIECLILEFHVNFNRNRVCDTRFATMNSSPSASRCQFAKQFRNDAN